MLTSLQQAHNLSGWEVSPTKVDQRIMQNFNPFFLSEEENNIYGTTRQKVGGNFRYFESTSELKPIHLFIQIVPN